MGDGIVGAIAISLFGSEKKRRDIMDAGYTILGNDVDVCRMFDPFAYKRNENLDFSLNVPQHHHQQQQQQQQHQHHHRHHHHHQACYHHEGYAMADQTFHTPSFGDEDFDIPVIHSHSHQHPHQHQQQQPQQHQPQQQQQQSQSDPLHGYQAQMMQTGGIQQSPDGLNLDPGGYQQSLYLQQDHPIQPISASSTYSNSPQASYTTVSSPRQQHGNQQMMLLQQQQQHQQHQQAQIQQHMQYMHSQQQQQLQQQIQYRSPTGSSPPAMQPSSVSEPNNNTTTSEDSDDSTPHSGMITGIKRPSPEPADVGTKNQRKPKSQKKKKKRDPNEPQKPVSAYALFFRDTQAAIKGQNPNASFGEVSKIVASMWDALDTEHKNVYKKKTEAAKKEYLQALAAYRASLVSKGATDTEQQQQQQQQQQPSPQQQQVQYATYGNYAGNGTSGNVSYQVYSPQPQPPSPQQQHAHSHSHQHQHQHPHQHQHQHQHQQQPPQMQMKKSPHHLAMSGNPQQQQSQQGLISNPMAPAHIPQQPQQSQPQTQQQQQHMQSQQAAQQQYMQVPQQQIQQIQVQQQSQQHHHSQQQQSQQQQIMHAAPPKGDSLSNASSVSSATQAAMAGQRPTSNACIRHGCPNPAVANSEWEDEYCSNECVVSHCRDVFNTWVTSNQNTQQNFSTVK